MRLVCRAFGRIAGDVLARLRFSDLYVNIGIHRSLQRFEIIAGHIKFSKAVRNVRFGLEHTYEGLEAGVVDETTLAQFAANEDGPGTNLGVISNYLARRTESQVAPDVDMSGDRLPPSQGGRRLGR
jgi:hypothetical protein